MAVVHATRGGSDRQADGGSSTPAASQGSMPGPTGATSPPTATSPPAASPSPSDTPSPTDSGVPTATELTDALTSYYAALPADTDAGWSGRFVADEQRVEVTPATTVLFKATSAEQKAAKKKPAPKNDDSDEDDATLTHCGASTRSPQGW